MTARSHLANHSHVPCRAVPLGYNEFDSTPHLCRQTRPGQPGRPAHDECWVFKVTSRAFVVDYLRSLRTMADKRITQYISPGAWALVRPQSNPGQIVGSR
jgi:hypothetical protein